MKTTETTEATDVRLQIETTRKNIEQLLNDGIRKVNATMYDNSRMTFRIFKSSNGNLCYFANNSRKWGNPLPLDQIIAIKPIKSIKSPEQKWRDGWEKVIARLNESGLWEDLIPDIQLALSMGYDKLNQAYQDYWKTDMEGQLNIFQTKYPELVKINDEGKPYVNTSIIWSYHRMPKVKKMCFVQNRRYRDPYRNEEILKTIQEKMDAKEKYQTSGRSSYDVSFEYNPENNRAWYSEEFKDCGNGHYYLALNSTHALFAEDD